MMSTFTDMTLWSAAVGAELTVRVAARSPGSPVLYLLHGLTGASDDWLRETDLGERATGLPFAVACLEGDNGYYTDRHGGGGDWERALFEQVEAVEERFSVGGDRARRALAGLSMGGFGAVKTALKYPERFAAAYSTSGSLDAARDPRSPLKHRLFGPDGGEHRQANDPFTLAERVPPERRPALAFDCGRDDAFLSANRRFDALLSRLGWQHTFAELPGGHDWPYFRARLPDLLAFAAAAFARGSG